MKTKLTLGLALCLALWGASSQECYANTITVSTTIDVGDIVPGLNGFTGGAQDTPPFTPPYSVTLAEGDTFDFTIDFVGSQTLTIDNLSFIWAFSYADVATDVTGTGTMYLLDATGNVLYTSIAKTTTEGSVHYGQQFLGSDFASLPGSITIGGIHFVGTITDYLDPDVTARTYDNPGLYFNADSFVVVPVPPAALLGFVLMGGLGVIRKLRRRSQNA